MTSEMIQTIRRIIDAGPIAKAKTSPLAANEARLAASDLSDKALVDLFKQSAEFSAGSVHVVEHPDRLTAIIAEIVPSGAKMAVCDLERINDRLGSDLLGLLGGVGRITNIDELSDEDLFDMDVAITGADFAIAETGSIIISSNSRRVRVASLVPAAHIVLIWRDQIAPDLVDVLESVDRAYSGKLPGGLTMISGPSKTADIEMQLVVGVHGPGQLHVLVI